MNGTWLVRGLKRQNFNLSGDAYGENQVLGHLVELRLHRLHPWSVMILSGS
jgi:hypothetical protein